MQRKNKLISLVVSLILAVSLFASVALAAAVPDSYTVKKGDNLTKIGKEFGYTWQELAEYNNIANPNMIDIGQVIRFPGGNTSEPEVVPVPVPPTSDTGSAEPDPSGDVTITILHTNDVHSRYIPSIDNSIGYAGLAAVFNATKAANPNTILLDAGDTLHGNTLATLSEGMSIVKLMNAVGYTAMTTGNHDYNYGSDRLAELSGEMAFPVLCANVLNQDGSPVFTPYIIKEIDGVKVAIFGLASPETLSKTHPDNVKGKVFISPVAAAEKLVPELRKQADVVIALTHLGWIADSERDSSQNLAQNVSGIDVIIDGHSHTKLENKLVNGVLIAQTGEYMNNIGKVTITLENGKIADKTAELISKSKAEAYGEDEAVLALIETLEEEKGTITERVVATSPVDLDGERQTNRTGETNLGNLMTEAMLEASGADVALTNGGGIRASIKAGPVTVGDVLTTFPFTNYGVVIDVTGADILAAIEYGVSYLPETFGGFPHIAGMTVKVTGNKVTELLIGGEPVDLKKTYTLVTNDFTAAGGDGYTMLAGKPVRAELGLNSEMFENYIAKKGFDKAVIDGRMTIN